jgi:uncharacterized protein
MTPQERELINSLFDRLRPLESNPRDGEAERAIADGLTRAPHAIYALVQTVLVQDEALKRANARIEELQAGNGGSQQAGGSFLDNMRSAVFGNDAGARGSVPPTRTAPAQQPQPAAYAAPPAANYAPPSGGPSFLGTAASVAAGAVGGGLLLDGIRSMFGHGSSFGGYGAGYSPWDAPVDAPVVADDVEPADYETADADDGDYDDGGYDDAGGDDGGGTDMA